MIAALVPNVDRGLHCRTMESTQPPPRAPRARRARRWAKRSLLALLGLLSLLVVGGVALHQPRPTGTPGPAAEALAQRVELAVGRAQWDQTGAVAWTLFGHRHLWDRQRGFVQVTYRDMRVLLRTADQSGVAFDDGQALRGPELRAALDKAWAYFCNDSFWLNPIVKVFDPGTTRSIVRVDGRDALLVEYSTGGVTPGDAYLWILGDDDLPTAWRMWVSVLPVGGIRVPWAGYVTLSTGAKVATEHRYGAVGFRVEDLRAAAQLSELVGAADPFTPLTR